jgi:hypothetical protein
LHEQHPLHHKLPLPPPHATPHFPLLRKKKRNKRQEIPTHLLKHCPHPGTRPGLSSSHSSCSARRCLPLPLLHSRSFSLCPFPPIRGRACPKPSANTPRTRLRTRTRAAGSERPRLGTSVQGYCEKKEKAMPVVPDSGCGQGEDAMRRYARQCRLLPCTSPLYPSHKPPRLDSRRDHHKHRPRPKDLKI